MKNWEIRGLGIGAVLNKTVFVEEDMVSVPARGQVLGWSRPEAGD